MEYFDLFLKPFAIAKNETLLLVILPTCFRFMLCPMSLKPKRPNLVSSTGECIAIMFMVLLLSNACKGTKQFLTKHL